MTIPTPSSIMSQRSRHRRLQPIHQHQTLKKLSTLSMLMVLFSAMIDTIFRLPRPVACLSELRQCVNRSLILSTASRLPNSRFQITGQMYKLTSRVLATRQALLLITENVFTFLMAASTTLKVAIKISNKDSPLTVKSSL